MHAFCHTQLYFAHHALAAMVFSQCSALVLCAVTFHLRDLTLMMTF